MEPVIPKIDGDVCYPIEKEMIDDNYLPTMAKHIREHNPILAGFIHSFVGKLPPCCKQAAMLSAFTTYRLIESQMEADRMNTDLKL